MIPAHAAASAFERLGALLPAAACRSSDAQCVRAFLGETQAQMAALAGEHDYLRCDRDRWSARALRLERELADARERERRSTAEFVALASAAQLLCAALETGAGSAGDVDAAAGAVRSALAGDHVQAIVLELQESTPTACLYAVLRRMFARMRTREALAAAAERWVVDQLRRHTPSFAERLRRRCPGRAELDPI